MPTSTLAQLEERVWSDLDGNQGFYPEPQVRRVLNEGLRRLNLLTGFNQATIPIEGQFTQAGVSVYQTPAGIVVPLTVYCEQAELKKSSLSSVGQRYRSWSTDSGTPARWAPIGLDRFLIHPADSKGGRLLEVSGIAPVTPLVGQNDVIGLEDEWTDLLLDYSHIRLMVKEGGNPFAQASLAYREMVRKLKTMSAWGDITWPRYWLIQQMEPSEGRGT